MRRRKIILPIFIALLMIFSIFGVVISSFGNSTDNTQKIDYNGYSFVFDGNIWFTFKDKQKIEFNFDPRELDSFDIGKLNSLVYGNNKIYISFNPEENLENEANKLRSILSIITQKQVFLSCYEDNKGCEELPLKTCEDSREGVLVIIIKNGEFNIEEDSGCIGIIGESLDFYKIIDKIRLGALL